MNSDITHQLSPRPNYLSCYPRSFCSSVLLMYVNYWLMSIVILRQITVSKLLRKLCTLSFERATSEQSNSPLAISTYIFLHTRPLRLRYYCFFNIEKQSTALWEIMIHNNASGNFRTKVNQVRRGRWRGISPH